MYCVHENGFDEQPACSPLADPDYLHSDVTLTYLDSDIAANNFAATNDYLDSDLALTYLDSDVAATNFFSHPRTLARCIGRSFHVQLPAFSSAAKKRLALQVDHKSNSPDQAQQNLGSR